MKLNFVCVGAQKSGTTTLDRLLRTYFPTILLPKVKETKFFCTEEKDQFINGISFYKNKYYPYADSEFDKKIVGEVDPEYLYFESSAINLYEHNPNLKIVILLRNPYDRMYSHYKMTLSRDIEDKSFNGGLDSESERLAQSSFNKNHYSYLSRSLYFEQVKKYVDLFGIENVKVYNFDVVMCNQNDFIKDLAQFLNVDNIESNIENIRSNANLVTRYRFIRKLVNRESFLRQVFRRYAGENFKYKLKSILLKLAFKESKVNSSGNIQDDVSDSIKSEVRADVLRLDELLGTNFYEYWEL